MIPYSEPAYPIAGSVTDYQFAGATLRDKFAMSALQGLIAEPGMGSASTIAKVRESKGYAASDNAALNFARASYALADAMLIARSE